MGRARPGLPYNDEASSRARVTMASVDDRSKIARADLVATHRRLERLAQERLGLPPSALMERAGEAAGRILRRHWPWSGWSLVLCGPGNNGGDGYALARRLRATGHGAVCLSWREPLTPEARTARDRFVAEGGQVVTTSELPAFLESWPHWRESVLVDALWGIGLSRDLDSTTCGLIAALEGRTREILALDIPTGLDAETGTARPTAFHARVTISFITPAPGHLTGRAAVYVGHLETDDLGLGQLLAEIPPDVEVSALHQLARLVPPRPPDAHKGLGGHVLVVGGNRGYGGAMRLAGEAALRAGAGLVTVVTHPEHLTAILAGCPSLMVRGVMEGKLDELNEKTAGVIAFGPGLGRDRWGRNLWYSLKHDARPLVLDADGLNLLSEEPFARVDWILTPHPGEAGRLLGTTAAAVQADRLAAARELVRRYGATVILKGAGTIVASPEGRVWIVPEACPELATAGTGDVLTGIVAGLRARGLSESTAALAGVLLHLMAARRALRARPYGLISKDLLEYIGL